MWLRSEEHLLLSDERTIQNSALRSGDHKGCNSSSQASPDFWFLWAPAYTHRDTYVQTCTQNKIGWWRNSDF